MGWFEETRMNRMSQNLSANNSSFATWGRGKFASNFAQGGIASYMFSPNGRRPWGSTTVGSSAYMQRLNAMQRVYPQYSGNIEKLKKSRPGIQKGNMLGVVGSVAAMGFIAAPAFMTKGSAGDKATASVAAGASIAGWEVGSKVGMAAGVKIGATVGSVVGPVGTAIGAGLGALIGYLGGGLAGSYGVEEGVHGARGVLDSIAAKGRRKRTWQGWYGDTSAFNTQKAVTMRQTSLQLMNQGMMSARSGLGHEGVMLHQ